MSVCWACRRCEGENGLDSAVTGRRLVSGRQRLSSWQLDSWRQLNLMVSSAVKHCSWLQAFLVAQTRRKAHRIARVSLTAPPAYFAYFAFLPTCLSPASLPAVLHHHHFAITTAIAITTSSTGTNPLKLFLLSLPLLALHLHTYTSTRRSHITSSTASSQPCPLHELGDPPLLAKFVLTIYSAKSRLSLNNTSCEFSCLPILFLLYSCPIVATAPPPPDANVFLPQSNTRLECLHIHYHKSYSVLTRLCFKVTSLPSKASLCENGA